MLWYWRRPAPWANAWYDSWAGQGRAACADELYLKAAPYESREAWCHALCEQAEARLGALDPGRSLAAIGAPVG